MNLSRTHISSTSLSEFSACLKQANLIIDCPRHPKILEKLETPKNHTLAAFFQRYHSFVSSGFDKTSFPYFQGLEVLNKVIYERVTELRSIIDERRNDQPFLSSQFAGMMQFKPRMVDVIDNKIAVLIQEVRLLRRLYISICTKLRHSSLV